MKSIVSLAAIIVVAALAACSSRPNAPLREQEAVRASQDAGTSTRAASDIRPAAKPGDVRDFILGDFAATALRDGALSFPNDNKIFGIGQKPADVAAVLSSAGEPTDKIEVSLQPLLIRTADRVMLFDTGAGDNFGPSAGRLLTSM